MAVVAPIESTATEDISEVNGGAEYLAFRSAVLEPLRLSDGLRVGSYDMSLLVEAMATSVRILAPDKGTS